MHLGLVTYNIAKDWNLDTLLEKCRQHGFEGVELRTTHAHKVEPLLTVEERQRVRQKFEAAGVVLWGLGTTCEYHSPDPEVLWQNIQTTKAFIDLARDVGAKGVKVRPNDLPAGVPVERTLQQIGEALRQVGQYALEKGVEVWLEVHGRGTSHIPHIRRIMEVANHPAVGVCWNSNPSDVVDGSIRQNFELIRDWILSVHLRDLYLPDYPWQELFNLLYRTGYGRFTLAEIPASPEPDRILGYFRALWEARLELAKRLA